MKLLRIWFVVLLAVLLPLRGATAATLPCAPGAGVGGSELRVQAAAEHEHASGHGHDAHAEHASHDHGNDAAPEHDHAAQKCNLCSASCSIPPVPSASVGLDEPLALTEASFPDLSAPAATFQSDGQERPPRTI